MENGITLETFKADHPFADSQKIGSLYKFFNYNEKNPEYLEDLFLNRNLYHSLPEKLNDPFECKPLFSVKNTPHQQYLLRKSLMDLVKRRGHSNSQARDIVSKNMLNPDKLKQDLSESILNIYQEIRVCCFTTTNTNLLLWSHYANSHKGLCVEFDSTHAPINITYKVKYQEHYPTISYPLERDQTIFKPILVKSPEWSYENEFRSIMHPSAPSQPPQTDTCYILDSKTIKAVYFGANILKENRNRIIDMINRGPFKPTLWQSEINKNSYSLNFVKI